MFTMLPWTWLLIIIVITWQISLSTAEIRVVCYYTNWSVYRPGTAKFNPQNINPYLCTHLIYAFGGFTKENNFKPFDKYQDIEKGGYAKFTGLKTYNKNLKTMLAVGGWNEGSSRFSPMVANAERRKEFVKNSVKFLRQNHFDGLDLDWEYPSFRDGGKPRDKDNYATLVQELREEYEREAEKTGRPRLLVTMAVPAGIEYINKGYDVPRLMKYLDWMNILSYDYHSAFEPAVNHHSPLYSLEEESEYNYDADLNINHTINHYLEAGAHHDKLVLGIPTYGRSYTLFNPDATQIGDPADGPGEMGDATRENGYLAYYEICEKIKDDSEWTVEQPNPKAMGPYAFKEDQWVGYDDESIVKKKAEFVAHRRLGGIMFWSIDNDDFRGACHGKPYPLIEAAKEALITASGSAIDNVITQPEKPSKTKSRTRTRPGSKKTADDDEESKPTQNSGGRQSIASTRKRVRPKSQKEEESSQISNKRRLRVQKKEEEDEEEEEEENDDDDDEEIVVSKKRRLRVHKESNNRRKESKRRGTTTTTTTTPKSTLSKYQTPKYQTPEPPTTPDPGGDFKCEDEGFFPHPRDCKKYFWCLSSGPSELGIVAHQFTCPSGLYFNKAADSCDYTQNVLCKKAKAKASTTTTTTTPSPTTTKTTTEATVRTISTTTRRPLPKITAATSRTTLVTTPDYQEEYEYEDDDEDADDIDDEDGPLDSEEDPQVIKELIALIKKAGGIEELEKQLNLDDGIVSVTLPGSTTPPSFSKTLYQRVLSRANARNTEKPSVNKNSRGPQYDGKSDDGSTSKRGRPQYTAISRFRSSTEKVESEEPELDNEEKSAKQEPSTRKIVQPAYRTISRSRSSTTSEYDVEVTTRSNLEDANIEKQTVTAQTPEYVTLKRKRPTTAEPTPKYVTIRGRTSSVTYEDDGKLTEATTIGNPSTILNDYKTSELSNNEYINTVDQQNITDTVEVSKILAGKTIPDEALNFGTEKIFTNQDETTKFTVNSQNSTENSLSENEQRPFSSSQRFRSSTIAIDTSTTASTKVSDPISSRNVLRSRPLQKATDSTDNSHINNSTNVTESTTKRALNRFNYQETNERFKGTRKRLPYNNKEQDSNLNDKNATDAEDDISNETDNPGESDKPSFISRPKTDSGSKTTQSRPRPFSPKRPVAINSNTEKLSTELNYNANRNEEVARTENTNAERRPTRRRGAAKYDYHELASGDGGGYYNDGSYDPYNDQKYSDRKFRPDIAAEIADLSSLTSADISKSRDAQRGLRRRIVPRQPTDTKEVNVTESRIVPALHEESSEDNVRKSLRPLSSIRKSLSGQEVGKTTKRTIKPSNETVTEESNPIEVSRIQKKSPVFIRPTIRKPLNDKRATNDTNSETPSVNLPKPKPRNNFSVLGRKRLNNQDSHEGAEKRDNLEQHLDNTTSSSNLTSESTTVISSKIKPTFLRKRLEQVNVTDEGNSENQTSLADLTNDEDTNPETNSNLPKPKSRRKHIDNTNNKTDATKEINSEDGTSSPNPLSTENDSSSEVTVVISPRPKIRNFASVTRKHTADSSEKANLENQSSSESPVTRHNRKVIRRFRPTTVSTSTITTTASTTTTESLENELNSEISQTESAVKTTTTPTEYSITEEFKQKLSTIPIIVTDDNDLKENITERGSSDNDEDVYRTSEEEEENIKLSETSIREKSEIRINALNDNSEKQRRRVVKKIRNEGKTSQTKFNYLENNDEKITENFRNFTAITEAAPIVRTRKIIRKLQPTTESTTVTSSTSNAPKGRTRKIIRRLRPTTTELPYRSSTARNGLEETVKTKTYGAKRIRPSFAEKSKDTEVITHISDEINSNNNDYPRYGFRKRQRINIKTELESKPTQSETVEDEDISEDEKPIIRRVGPQRRQRIKIPITKVDEEEDENDSRERESAEDTPFSRRRLKLTTTKIANNNSEDASTSQEQRPFIRRVVPQRRKKIKVYGDGSSEVTDAKDENTNLKATETATEENLQRKKLFANRRIASDATNKAKNTEEDLKTPSAAINNTSQTEENATHIEQNNSTSLETDPEIDENHNPEIETTETPLLNNNETDLTEPEEFTTLESDLSSTTSSIDLLPTTSSDISTKSTENTKSEEISASTETSTKSYRNRLNRIQISTTTKATIQRERFNIFSRFNSKRRENVKPQNETSVTVSAIEGVNTELNNETNIELNNLTRSENATEEYSSSTTTETDGEVESTTLITDEDEAGEEDDTTINLDEITEQTTIDDLTTEPFDFTTTEIPQEATEKSTTVRTTTPFYYRAKLSRPPFVLQRNRAVTESSKPTLTTSKEYTRGNGFSRYSSRKKDRYKSRYDNPSSTESLEKITVENTNNVTEDNSSVDNSNVTEAHNQTIVNSVNVTDSPSSSSTTTLEPQTTENESVTTEGATTPVFNSTEITKDDSIENNTATVNQTTTEDVSSFINTSTIESLNSTVSTEEVGGEYIQNITDSILDAELLALIQQYEAERAAIDALEKAGHVTSDDQNGGVNKTEENVTITAENATVGDENRTQTLDNPTHLIKDFISSSLDELINNANKSETSSTTESVSTPSSTESTVSTTSPRRGFVPKRRTFTTTSTTPKSENVAVEKQEQHRTFGKPTLQRPKYKPRGKPTERTLLYKQTTRRVTLSSNEVDRSTPGRSRFYLRSTTEGTKSDNEDLNLGVTETPEEVTDDEDEEEYYDDEDEDEEYENEGEEEGEPTDVKATTERSSNLLNRSNKPQYVPKRPNYRPSTERPSSVVPKRFGGIKNTPIGKQANTPAPNGNAVNKNTRNKLFNNKSRKVNTPYPGISVLSTTTTTTDSTTESTTSSTTISTTNAETSSTLSTSTPEVTSGSTEQQEVNAMETTTGATATTDARSTTETPEQIITLHHIFSETESTTQTTTEMSSSEVTGASADKKLERLIEVNRIVEVSLKEGKLKHNAMVESEVTLSPTLDRIGAINRVTVIKVVDPVNGTNASEIFSSLTSSLKDADKLRLNVTLPRDDVNKQQSLINDIINAISSDLNTKAINISIINDLTASNITDTTEKNKLTLSSNLGDNLVNNGTKLEENNLLEKATVKEDVKPKEDPNLIHIYSSGEVIDAIVEPHTKEEENFAKAHLRIDGKSVVNTFTPKPPFISESSTIALEGLFQPDWNKAHREQSNNDEILQTQNANYVNIKILDQDGFSRRLRLNDVQPLVPIRLLKQDEYTTSRAEVIEITPEMNSGVIKIAPIAISVGNMQPIAQHKQSENTEHTTVVFPVSVSRSDE